MNTETFTGSILKLFFSFAATALFVTSGTAEPHSYPGALWMLSGIEGNGNEGANTQGFLRQGMEIAKLPAGQPLQVYGQFNWRFRGVNENYYNAYTPYIGTMLSFKNIDTGVEFGWPKYTELNSSLKNYDIFANWFKYWGLLPWSKERFIKAMPLTTWGNVSYDLTNQDGSSTMGWIKLETDLFWLPHNFMAGPYVSCDWRLRTRNADYFNMHGVTGGLSLGNDHLQLGAQFAWRRYPELHQQTRSLELFISLYQTWDLKRGG